jgi:hypothetical protein
MLVEKNGSKEEQKNISEKLFGINSMINAILEE